MSIKTLTAAALLACSPQWTAHAQETKSPPEARAGAMHYGIHCSVCHGVRLMKDDAAHDLATWARGANKEQFVRGAKTARGAMPSFASQLSDAELERIWLYVSRGHTRDLDDVPMESNH
jgi:mono/diheme cytochrome c family protein